MTLQEIQVRLVEVINRYHGLDIPEYQLENMIELSGAGEPGVALELFCSQLYEFDIPVRAEDLAALRAFGESMRISPDYWTRLSIDEKEPH